MVHDMSAPQDPGGRSRFVDRFAANVTRSDEEVRDWLNGDGQKWLAVWVVVVVLGLLWAVATSFGG